MVDASAVTKKYAAKSINKPAFNGAVDARVQNTRITVSPSLELQLVVAAAEQFVAAAIAVKFVLVAVAGQCADVGQGLAQVVGDPMGYD